MTNNLIPVKSGKITKMQAALIESLGKYKSWYDAAIAAGYSENSAKNIKALVGRNPAFTTALKQKYIDNTALQLNDIAMIESNVLEYCANKNNIQDVPKHAQTLKQIKQAAGVLQEDQAPKHITINVDTIERIQIAVSDMLKSRLSPVNTDT